MGLHLYCVTPADHKPSGVPGLDDAPVTTIDADDLAVWVSPAAAPIRASVEAVQRHHAVIEAAMQQVTPVPLRFGQWLADEADVRTRTAARAAEWRTQLAELAGTAEYGVHIIDPRLSAPARDVRPEPTDSGRAYLEALAGHRAEHARRSAAGRVIAAELESELGPTVVGSRVEALETAHGLASVAFLVRRDSATDYRDALARAVAARRELRFLTSGPWPPYTFVT